MDENLFFNVAQLLKESVGATRAATVIADVYRLVPELAEFCVPDAVEQPELSGRVRLMRTGDGILAQGDLSAELTLPCSRCLEPVVVPISL